MEETIESLKKENLFLIMKNSNNDKFDASNNINTNVIVAKGKNNKNDINTLVINRNKEHIETDDDSVDMKSAQRDDINHDEKRDSRDRRDSYSHDYQDRHDLHVQDPIGRITMSFEQDVDFLHRKIEDYNITPFECSQFGLKLLRIAGEHCADRYSKDNKDTLSVIKRRSETVTQDALDHIDAEFDETIAVSNKNNDKNSNNNNGDDMLHDNKAQLQTRDLISHLFPKIPKIKPNRDNDERDNKILIRTDSRINILNDEIVEINKWLDECDKILTLKFEENQFQTEYPESFRMVYNNNNKLFKLGGYVRNIFSNKMQAANEIKNFRSTIEFNKNEINLTQSEINELNFDLLKIKTLMCDNFEKYFSIYKKLICLVTKKTDLEYTNKQLNKKMNGQNIIVEKYEKLLLKYNQFRENTPNYIKNMEIKRNESLDNFERSWLNWDYKDIVFWFAVILKYYQTQAKFSILTTEKNININDKGKPSNVNYNNNDNKTTKQQQQQIDFDKICDNLENGKIRGKYISLLNRSDLENFGIIGIKNQLLIVESISLLVEKYPIPIERVDENNLNPMDDGNDNGGQVEGLLLHDTLTGGNINNNNNNNNEKDIDKKYICPITNEIMKDPVIAYDGYTYEKSAIIGYLRKHGHSPHSKDKLNQDIEMVIQMLFEDLQLKQDIHRLRQ